MISEELRAQIKKIKIIAKRLVKTSFAGDYLSAFKGMGMEFHQLREYFPGDDVRQIAWNSYVKTQKLMVKQFIEERDRTVILAIDISASSFYSSKEELREETIAQLASVLAFVASENKDKVGALFFSDRIEKWIPPSRKQSNIGVIIENILTLRSSDRGTNINEALRFLVDMNMRNAIVFMLSDWIDSASSYSKLLKVTSCKHDLIAVRLLDDCEKSFSNVGLIDVCDPETGKMMTLNASKSLDNYLGERVVKQKKMFDSCQIDLLDIKVGYPFINDLTKFFHRRIRRSI